MWGKNTKYPTLSDFFLIYLYSYNIFVLARFYLFFITRCTMCALYLATFCVIFDPETNVLMKKKVLSTAFRKNIMIIIESSQTLINKTTFRYPCYFGNVNPWYYSERTVILVRPETLFGYTFYKAMMLVDWRIYLYDLFVSVHISLFHHYRICCSCPWFTNVKGWRACTRSGSRKPVFQKRKEAAISNGVPSPIKMI